MGSWALGADSRDGVGLKKPKTSAVSHAVQLGVAALVPHQHAAVLSYPTLTKRVVVHLGGAEPSAFDSGHHFVRFRLQHNPDKPGRGVEDGVAGNGGG